MKKLNYLLLGAAALALASCSQEDLVGPAQGDGNFNVTVKLPADLTTRAAEEFGLGYVANNLTVNVYDADNDALVLSDPIENAFSSTSLETTVSLNLAKGKTYNIAFFAQSAASNDVYTIDNPSGVITVNYDKMTSANNLQDAYDCFFTLINTGEIPSTTTNTTAILTRPVAQINWGTDDLNEASVNSDNVFGANATNLQTQLVTKAYTQFSMLDQTVVSGTDNAQITIAKLAAPASEDHLFPVDPAQYEYVSMQYLLAPGEETIYDLELTISNDAAGADGTFADGVYTNNIVVSSAPVQANYRTNIYGSLLTDNYNINVVKDPTWGTPDYDPSLALAFKMGGIFKLEHDFTLDQNLVLNRNLTIDLNGYDITYTGEEEGMFYIVEGGNLTIIGEGNVTSEKYYTPIFVDGGEVTIEGGNYWVPDLTGQIVYVYEGTAYIKGGTYAMENMKFNTYPYYTLNCEDQSYREGIAHIYVSGGSFLLFNPGAAPSEGSPYVSFLAPGYQSLESQINGETYYTVIPEDYTPVSTQQDLQNAVGTPDATLYLQGETYTFPNNVASGVTFIGSDNTTINIGDSQPGSYNNVTFKNIKFIGGTAYRGLQHSSNLKYMNCEFEDLIFSYADGLEFTDCVFNRSNANEYNIWTYTANNVVFSNCTFNCAGKAVLIYNELGASSPVLTITFDNCKFNASAAVEGKAAIEIGSGSPFVVNINNCTAVGFDNGSLSGNPLWNHKVTTNPCTVNVDGQQVYTNP